MDRLFPLPVYTFLKIVLENGGFSAKGIKNLPPWILKTIVFEPLRWIELAAHRQRIKNHKIKEPPLFILGYYRSGTTFLQQLFMQDERMGYTSLFQMIFPELMLTFEKPLTPVFEKLSGLLKMYNPVHRVPLNWFFPGEEDAAMATSVNPRSAQWGSFFPEKARDYFEKFVFYRGIDHIEKEKWCHDYLYLVKKISLANQQKSLVLKSPPHTARIGILLRLFPDARFIHIHRDPYEVFASNQRLWTVVQNIYTLGKTRQVDFDSLILENYSQMMSSLLEEKTRIAEGQWVELAFQDLVNSPVKSMQRIYQKLRLGDFEFCREKLESYAQLQNKHKMLQYSLSGEEINAVSEKWERFIRHWDYPVRYS